MGMKHILVASDLTDRSERALGRALQLTSPSGHQGQIPRLQRVAKLNIERQPLDRRA